MKKLFVLLALVALAAIGAHANPFEYNWQELAPGVWGGIRQDPFELPQEGNSLFVVGDQGVIVFDAGGSPAMGESIVAKVRSITDKPITHVIISHWHGDHMRGLQAITAAFPRVVIVAHPHTREWIVNTQDRWLKRRVNMVPGIRKAVSSALEKQQDASGRPLIAEEKAWLEKGLSITDQLDRENNRTAYVIPNATFTDRMTLHLGAREVQLIHPPNSHTAGDVILWLPQEKIVATGDIVTGPIPLMQNPWTHDYAAVLGQIKALEFKTLVPGHGLVLHDAQYVDLLIELFQTAAAQMKSLVSKGLSKDNAIAKLDLTTVERKFTHGDAFLTNRFRDYVISSLPEAAYLAETGAEVKESF